MIVFQTSEFRKFEFSWREGTLWSFNVAIENCNLSWVFPLKLVIFYSYVSLPEGNWWLMFYKHEYQSADLLMEI